MAYIVYILKSLADGSYYIGYTHDMSTRLYKHNASRTGYTSKKKPWTVIYTESYRNKELAIKREIYLKKMKSKIFIEDLIKVKSP